MPFDTAMGLTEKVPADPSARVVAVVTDSRCASLIGWALFLGVVANQRAFKRVQRIRPWWFVITQPGTPGRFAGSAGTADQGCSICGGGFALVM